MFEGLFGTRAKSTMVAREDALRGRAESVLPYPQPHAVLGTSIVGPWPGNAQVIYLALGCFWGEERLYWELPGVLSTAVGYQGGFTENPTYEEVCSGRTGHAEAIQVVYDPAVISDQEILSTFWEAHDPTQGYRQGNDVGTQYRSAIFWTTPEQGELALQTRDLFEAKLAASGYGEITTQILPASEAGPFYYAEDYHQQYLKKNPGGYCPVHSTGVKCTA